MFFRLAMNVGQSKNSEPPRGIEPQTFRFSRSGASPLIHRDSTESESSLWHAFCMLLVLKRLVNKHFIIFFVLVHLLSISLSIVNNYYTISLLSLINVPCKHTCKDFTSVIDTKSSLFDNRYRLFATVTSYTKVSLYFFFINVVYLFYVLLV